MIFSRMLKNTFDVVTKQFKYSLSIIFANKFIYFLGGAFIIYLLITIISLFSSGNMEVEDVFYFLLFLGLILIFYPTTFGIQNDEDSRMLENIFAIPNYRYKVWLPRLGMIYIIVFAILVVFSLLSSFALVVVPVFELVYHLMYPIFFIGSISFALSTLVKNGIGTAVIIVIILLIFWIASAILQDSAWNIFLNPYDLPRQMSISIWETVVNSNRLYLLAGTIIAILYGLINLQNREKFV